MKKKMTRILAMTLALAMVLVGAASATAVAGSNFVASIEQKGAPTIAQMTSADGTPCYGIVYNADGSEAYVITDAGELIVTPYSARVEAAADIRSNLESAYKDIAGAEDLSKLTKELEDTVNQLRTQIGIKDLGVAELFDITARGNLIDPLYQKGAKLVIVLETQVTLTEATFVLHDAFYDGAGQWDLRPSTVLDEHHVQVTFDGLSHVALVVPIRDVPVDPDGPKSPDTGLESVWFWAAAAAVVTVGCVVAASRKHHA